MYNRYFYRTLTSLVTALIFIGPLTLHSQNCEKVRLADFPPSDLPSKFDTSGAEQEKWKNWGAYKFYYGIGVPVDYVKARHLAFFEMALNREEDDPFAGASILMMLYANGFGVKRDLNLSIRLACANVGFAEAEIEGRVEHLKKLSSGEFKEVFDLCDDITSGYMMGFCAGVHSEMDSIRRQKTIDSVMKGWPKKDSEAYATLRKAASDYFKERVFSEVDMSGTARAAEEVGEQETLEESFKEKIVTADKCGFTLYKDGQLNDADKELNNVYSKVMNAKDPIWGTVTKQRIRATQRAWLRYRDAWVIFGAVRCPEVTASSLKTLLTKERTLQLGEFIDQK